MWLVYVGVLSLLIEATTAHNYTADGFGTGMTVYGSFPGEIANDWRPPMWTTLQLIIPILKITLPSISLINNTLVSLDH